ncbi:hypothetical protein PPYR_00224 [Photinus pyralis]|uniref:DDE Tnp4 domain-containing protein n=1 Tax=Photinus pyralis TaxID=7054 RepID=A0A5N4B0Z2_PHOPY|nr:hypothetical protein PPYR_00224 [Photinus pyralis]
MNNEVLLQILYYANEIFDFFEYEEEGATLPKVIDFAEYTVPRFDTHQFREHFRLLPDTFDIILGYLHDIKNREHRKPDGRQEIYLEKQLLITIWYLANLESFRSVASRFNVSKSTCWDILQRTSKRLLNVNALYGIIKWPTEEEALLTMQSFERRSHFPGILGCIDGSHIKILAPQHSPNSYVNRKHFHSILVQGVCNHKRMFIDLYAGEPGSLHDSNLFSKSDLCERIENGTVQFYNNSHLVGDLAYKLSTSLIVGFKNLGNLTEMQINFNKKLNAELK